jgi:hypothetical protein
LKRNAHIRLNPVRKAVSCSLIILIMLILHGCQKASELDIPSYISIDSISIGIQEEQGSASSKIIDAWVYTDNDLEGAFELPASFPVLKSGQTVIRIQPGIKLNGIAETRAPYPFYDTIAIERTLSRENTVKLGHLTARYKSNTVFGWIEDFEDPYLSLDSTNRSTLKISRVADESLATIVEGESNHYAGKIQFKNDSAVFESTSHDHFQFSNSVPEEQSYVFLEMNYKSNCTFSVGLIIYGSQTIQQPVVVVNPSGVWNKIYINFTPTISTSTAASSFKVYFYARPDEDAENQEILIDNIKLLHF